MTEVCRLSPELRAYWSQLTWRDWDLQCWRVLSSFLFLQGSLKPCFHTIAEKKTAIAAPTIAESPISAGRYDRWRVVSIWSLRSPNVFFFSDQKETRLSSKYVSRYCSATLVTFKEQYPVTARMYQKMRGEQDSLEKSVCIALGRVRYYTKTSQDYRPIIYCSR